jgi:hypothetical protein
MFCSTQATLVTSTSARSRMSLPTSPRYKQLPHSPFASVQSGASLASFSAQTTVRMFDAEGHFQRGLDAPCFPLS